MTTDEARAFREVAEAEILVALKKLTKLTNLDIVSVNVMLIVKADDKGDPRREAETVRIDLAV